MISRYLHPEAPVIHDFEMTMDGPFYKEVVYFFTCELINETVNLLTVTGVVDKETLAPMELTPKARLMCKIGVEKNEKTIKKILENLKR